MAIVQKTIFVKVEITVEVDLDLMGKEGYDYPSNVGDNVVMALEHFDSAGELFRGGSVKECCAKVIDVQDTKFKYG